MPRKPRQDKQKITVVVNGSPVVVTLHPPDDSRKSWYAYWAGAKYSRSTGCSRYEDAVTSVENMLRGKGKRNQLRDAVLSDEEFIEIQKRHFGKKNDKAAQARAEKSVVSCLEAISAFKAITGIDRIADATPDDCERFQHQALMLPKNWRAKHPKSQSDVECLSPNTVVKWSVALQAAFERSNRNAGKKCVRGVVPEDKLLGDNPWRKFTWIEGREKDIRQFDYGELLSLLDFFVAEWPNVTFAPAFVKVSLWSWGRRQEISSLRWDEARVLGNEFHFEITGKWGVTKWFRIPETLYQELLSLRNDSPYVFGCYSHQLKSIHLSRGKTSAARRVIAEFNPVNVGDWMYRQVVDWSKTLPNGSAYLHIFRKTSIQYARSGEDLNRIVANDAKLTESVMMKSYARETDEELRQKSNRTYRRICNSLSVEVSARYGYEEKPADRLTERLDLARSQGNWDEVARLAAELSGLNRTAG